MYRTRLATSLLVPLALVLGVVSARAETENCTPITSLPAVITTQGIHCLTGNLETAMMAGNAIEVMTSNVVIDLNGFKLGGLPAGAGTSTVGIFASDRQNITIKNGTVRGFMQGIFLDGTGASQAHVVEDVRADRNTVVGINVHGSGNIVRNNQVVATGGSTCCADSTGILVQGEGPRVINNDVIDMVNLSPGFGTTRAIYFLAANGGLAVNNRITVADKGIEFVEPGKYSGNLTYGVPAAMRFIGGTAVGIND